MKRAIFFSTLDNETVLILLLPWLDPDSLLHLDTAIVTDNDPLHQLSPSTLRSNWLGCLKGTAGTCCVNGLPCSSSWIKWFSLRGVGVTSIRILDAFTPQITDESFERACLSSLQHIDLSGCSDVSDAGIIAVVTTSPLLSTIKLTGCENITSKALISISKNCSQLKLIDLARGPLITSKAIQKLVRGCPLLESIDISGCSCVSAKTVKSIARYLPGLLHITFSMISGRLNSIAEDSVILLAYRCPLLQSIIIEDSEISDDSLVAIGQRCPQLRNICVSCTGVTDIGIAALVEGCTLLESITLVDVNDMTNESVMKIARHCPRMLHIHFHWLQHLNDSGVRALSLGCPLLQSLRLTRCHGIGIDNRFVEHIGTMRSLRKIAIENSDISDSQVTCIVKGSTTLETIDLWECSRLTSQTMMAIAEHCPTLTQLNTSDSNVIAEAALVAVVEGCKLLQGISFAEEDGSFSSVVFDSIGQHCIRLRKIDVKMTFTVTDHGFLSLLIGCPQIESISLVAKGYSSTTEVISGGDRPRPCGACLHLIEIILENCNDLTDLTLLNIGDMCTALVNLDIRDCCRMTDSCIEELEEELPHLN